MADAGRSSSSSTIARWWGALRTRPHSRRGRWLRRLFVLLLAALALFVAFCRPETMDRPTSDRSVLPVGVAWPSVHANPGATRATDADAAIEGDVAWVYPLDVPLAVAPVADGGALYLSTTASELVAVAARDGQVRWFVSVPGQLDAAPVIAGDWMYMVLRGGTLTALDVADGAAVWSVITPHAFGASLVVVDGVLWLASPGRFDAYDAETGRHLKQLDTAGTDMPVIAVVGEYVVVSVTNDVRIYNRDTGAGTFHYPLRQPVHLIATASSVLVFSPTFVVAVDPETRHPWWERARGAWSQLWIWGMAPVVPAPERLWGRRLPTPQFAPALTEEVVILAGLEGGVSAWSLSTGETQWERADLTSRAAPQITGGGLLLVTEDALVILDPESGLEIGRRVLEGGLRSATVTAHGTYVVTDAREVIGLR